MPSVAQGGDRIRDIEDLIEMVGHVEDTAARRGELADERQERRSFGRRKCRCRFIEYEKAGVLRDRPSDFDNTTCRCPVVRHSPSGINVDTEGLEDLACSGDRCGAVEHAESRRQGSKEDVLRDSLVQSDLGFLMDDSEPECPRRCRPVEAIFSTVDDDSTRIRLSGSGQHPDQSRLARSVLANQGVHLAALNLHGDVIKRDLTWVALCDPLEFNKNGL